MALARYVVDAVVLEGGGSGRWPGPTGCPRPGSRFSSPATERVATRPSALAPDGPRGPTGPQSISKTRSCGYRKDLVDAGFNSRTGPSTGTSPSSGPTARRSGTVWKVARS